MQYISLIPYSLPQHPYQTLTVQDSLYLVPLLCTILSTSFQENFKLLKFCFLDQEVLPTAPNTFEVREGQSLTLVCPTASFPPATFYTWSRESTPSSSSSPTLSEGSSPVYDIVNASLTDAGVYVCRSTNNYASTIDATLRVFVLGKRRRNKKRCESLLVLCAATYA